MLAQALGKLGSRNVVQDRCLWGLCSTGCVVHYARLQHAMGTQQPHHEQVLDTSSCKTGHLVLYHRRDPTVPAAATKWVSEENHSSESVQLAQQLLRCD